MPADLSAAVDVYSDWVDACDAVAREGEEDRGGDFAPSRAPAAGRPSAGRARDQEDEMMMILLMMRMRMEWMVMVGKGLLRMMSIRGWHSNGWVGEFWVCERRWVGFTYEENGF